MNAMLRPNLLTSDNEVFVCYVFYSCLLFLKIFAIAIFTAVQRTRKKAYISPEDLKFAVDGEVREDPDVERVRRAHLNDLENIPIFILSGLLFVLIDPNVILAKWFFRIYTIARFLHSIVYILAVPQPARTLMYMIGLTINLALIVILIYNNLSF